MFTMKTDIEIGGYNETSHMLPLGQLYRVSRHDALVVLSVTDLRLLLQTFRCHPSSLDIPWVRGSCNRGPYFRAM